MKAQQSTTNHVKVFRLMTRLTTRCSFHDSWMLGILLIDFSFGNGVGFEPTLLQFITECLTS